MNLSELAINIIDNLQTQAYNKRIKIQSEIEKMSSLRHMKIK